VVVALIPARGGSERVPDKNIRKLGGIPLVSWTIRAAIKSKLFDRIMVSSDSKAIGDIAIKHGVEWVKRPKKYATAKSPDIEWIRHAVKDIPQNTDFMILRPTNPFRRAATIKRAFDEWRKGNHADSLRSVRPVKEHPHKMWVRDGQYLRPVELKERHIDELEWPCWTSYDLPTQVLPKWFIQSGCIQMFHGFILNYWNNQTGVTILPFFTSDDEAFDINTEADWQMAEQMCKRIKPEKI
jgi:N-acylneuraminate cytidylyltransferase